MNSEANDAVLKHQQKLLNVNAWRSCLNCSKFIFGPPHNRQYKCGLTETTPPAEILVHGCEEWEREIPF